MKLKKLLLVSILVLSVSLFVFSAPLNANGFPVPVEDLQLTAVCSDNPSVARYWKITNPNNVIVRVSVNYKYETDPGTWSPYFDIGANSTYTIDFSAQDGHPHFIESLDLRWMDQGISGVWVDINPPVPTTDANCSSSPSPSQQWVRTMPMTVWQVWINEDNNFQFIFWYPYKDNNWVRIYDMDGNMVFEVDLPVHDPNLIVDLPDGMYTVKTYHDQELLQEFIIGKP